MCGIIGILSRAPVAPLLLDALRRLEYRGYDSAGIATIESGALERRRRRRLHALAKGGEANRRGHHRRAGVLPLGFGLHHS